MAFAEVDSIYNPTNHKFSASSWPTRWPVWKVAQLASWLSGRFRAYGNASPASAHSIHNPPRCIR
jgi:hypothetical protein